MRLKEFLLTEGFFKNYFLVSDKNEINKLSLYYGKNWNKSKNTWTMHDGDNHLFTYNVKTKELMTDKSKSELLKIIKMD